MKSFTLLFLAVFSVVPACAQVMPVTVDVQYSLFVKVLTYDRALEKGSRNPIVIGVLYQDGSGVSIQAKDRFLEAVAESDTKEIFGRPIECVPIAANGSALPTGVDSADIDILYITPVQALSIPLLANLMAENKILTVTGVPEYVEEGIAIGIGLREDKPAILINLPCAKNQGADLSAQLLHLAIIVR